MPAFKANFQEWGTKIIAIDKNHTSLLEQLKEKAPISPVYYIKPVTTYSRPNTPILIPEHHVMEGGIELGFVIRYGGKHIPESDAMKYVKGYLTVFNINAKDMKEEALSKKLPWSKMACFNTSTACGKFIEYRLIPNPNVVELMLEKNGQVVQKGDTSQMIFKVPYLISYLSRFMTLKDNDVILTGTIANPQILSLGDQYKACLNGKDYFDLYRVAAAPKS